MYSDLYLYYFENFELSYSKSHYPNPRCFDLHLKVKAIPVGKPLLVTWMPPKFGHRRASRMIFDSRLFPHLIGVCHFLADFFFSLKVVVYRMRIWHSLRTDHSQFSLETKQGGARSRIYSHRRSTLWIPSWDRVLSLGQSSLPHQLLLEVSLSRNRPPFPWFHVPKSSSCLKIDFPAFTNHFRVIILLSILWFV